ncbi:hypothetical protein Tco_0319369 [Tanacetum coccineum]
MANLSEDIQWASKENGVNILKSIDEGPFQMGTFWETLAEGNEGALHLGLPKDIYTLINHYTNAKDIWDNVKMLLEGSELTKEDRESQLYDDFEHFRQNKGETIHDYYIRFVTAVKLNRVLRDSNYDQLYAYLKQHEAHANENKMITSSNTKNQATFKDGRVVVQNVQGRQNRGKGNNAQGVGTAGYGGAQNRVGNANPGQARQIKCYNCNAQENEVALDEEQLLFIAGGQNNAIGEDADGCDAFDSDVDEAPTAQTMFMANLSSTYLVYDEASLSYDSDILFEGLKQWTSKHSNSIPPLVRVLLMYCFIVSAIASASSSSKYSWSESRLKSGDLNSSRLRVLKCLLDDRNSRSDDRYAVSNGGGYAVLICWNEYAVLDRELDTPYSMEVDTPYSTVDQNSGLKQWHGYAVSSLMDTAYWSSE